MAKISTLLAAFGALDTTWNSSNFQSQPPTASPGARKRRVARKAKRLARRNNRK